MKKRLYIFTLLALLPYLAQAQRQLPPIGNANGLDTVNASGAMRATRAFIVLDTFTNKPGDFLQLRRSGSKLTYIDSAGRLFIPEVMINTTTRAGHVLDAPLGSVRFGGTAYITDLRNTAQGSTLVLRNNGSADGGIVIGGNGIKTSGYIGTRVTIVNPGSSYTNFTGSGTFIGRGVFSTATSGINNVGVGINIGSGVTNGSNNTIIGFTDANNLRSNFSNNIHLLGGQGYSGNDASVMPPDGHCFIGGGSINNFYLGYMPYDSNAATATVAIHAPSGRGTNKGGATLAVRPGAGTGSATNMGDLLLQTSTAAASGTTVQSYSTRLTVKGNTGHVILNNVPEYTDNAAALAGGLAVGTIYRTGDNLKIVH